MAGKSASRDSQQDLAAIERLMADSRLVELCELQRTGDEVLDVIGLTENQHSDILAWMLDAREGHGQGDEILRDLLISASTAASSDDCPLNGSGLTARFFKKWTPSRIRTASFGAAFTARELGLKKDERVDLFVIDEQNKLILVVENKSRAMHSHAQLTGYRKSFDELVKNNTRLRNFQPAFIALDRKFDGDDGFLPPAADTWLHLGYDWLKTSAVRALMDVNRGNSAAKLVVSYCNRQTDWESPDAEKSVGLAASLHQAHPEAVRLLLEFSGGRLESEWLKRTSGSELLLFLLQNKGAVRLLKETRGMATVWSAIYARLPHLPKDNVAYKRAWLDLCPSGWEQYVGDTWWPVFLNVRFADDSGSKYTLALCWNANSARDAKEAADLRERLKRVEPRFKKHPDSNWRRVVVDRSATLSEVLRSIADLNEKLAKAIKSS